MENRTFKIKVMDLTELEIAAKWALQEGWNPGLSDARCYYQADPNGFLIGYLGDEPIASISVVKYDDSFGFLGFYIVKPEYRGQGYGMQIWQAGLQYLAGCNVALDGVVAQQENYKKSGFKLAYRNIRYEGVGGGETPDCTNLVALERLPIEEVIAYDSAFFPAKRVAFVDAWINQPNCHALGIKQDDTLVAIGVIRPCHVGYKIGPLYADNVELAETLFLALRSKVSATEAIYLDVPEVNAAAAALAQKYKMSLSFETARMYTGERPDLPLTRVFGVTSFEIG
ncbi:GNAT family N-acetyltransferase [Pseudoalteromonas sp. L23]|uniref:GNAT family N-acetyltransferase n=1 Tax=unclassified Pseudoalteromonas TaxID=194690 RepID=UPI001EF13E8A|nr:MULTISPECIES: GNAT family N-acetyltransferase [unclassified Pseudoalteromonas]MCF7513239.1 GNAT family N-acetyltransferase [Pseudoalteromonas sp. L7]MCF7525279.1 GNAT family N-acetyltransferase [Pseudoalteromonas sp. L23]MCX2765705.1 GNAT family N-acetyltransferase [Pseudoalteromonas sp. B530]